MFGKDNIGWTPASRNYHSIIIQTMIFTKEIIDFNNLSKEEIKLKLNELNIALTPDEALQVQKEMLGRPPSIHELVLFSIQGSEHCSYKSSRNHLKKFTTDGPHVVLGAKEDAGVVSIATDKNGKRWCIVMSHESHNHPSQIVPYEGAATGVGGNVRDVMCMGAEVIACTDSFRFGDIKNQKTKWIHHGVVSGVAGYGNPLGIPNIGGDVYYNERYNDNCLVTLVTLGIVREDNIIHSYAPENADGHDLILIGKPTDNSGFGGASFASLELVEDEKEKNKGAVQEPNAFLERHLLKSSYDLFKILQKENLIDKVGFKDLGAGGVACASVELAETSGYGATVDLDKVHKSMKDLHSSVYLCSETQERFMWVCPPDLTQRILDHYNKRYDLNNVSKGAQASVIGKITKDTKYIVESKDEIIVDAEASQVTKGFLYDRPFTKNNIIHKEPLINQISDYNQLLLQCLSHENFASREPIFEKYDKQVQGRSIMESGQNDAGVLAPFNSDEYPEEIQDIGIALSTDHNPRYAMIDPYWGGINAVVESVRNVVACGATPVALTDCLCFGNPENEQQMWEFVESVRGISDACNAITLISNEEKPLPIIAGNVSFYNESREGSIPPSPIVSCLGKLNDVKKVTPMSFQKSDSTLIVIGKRKDELGGSLFYQIHNELGANVPKPNLKQFKNQIHVLNSINENGLISSCHDISDGGMICALAEMTFENKIGCSIDYEETININSILFGETSGFIIEVENENMNQIKIELKEKGIEYIVIGKTTNNEKITFNDKINIDIETCFNAWTGGLREKL